MTPTDDAAAILRSFDEPAAFGAVFDRHFAAVHAFAQRRVGPGLAEKIAAETLRHPPGALPCLISIFSASSPRPSSRPRTARSRRRHPGVTGARS